MMFFLVTMGDGFSKQSNAIFTVCNHWEDYSIFTSRLHFEIYVCFITSILCVKTEHWGRLFCYLLQTFSSRLTMKKNLFHSIRISLWRFQSLIFFAHFFQFFHGLVQSPPILKALFIAILWIYCWFFVF